MQVGVVEGVVEVVEVEVEVEWVCRERDQRLGELEARQARELGETLAAAGEGGQGAVSEGDVTALAQHQVPTLTWPPATCHPPPATWQPSPGHLATSSPAPRQVDERQLVTSKFESEVEALMAVQVRCWRHWRC